MWWLVSSPLSFVLCTDCIQSLQNKPYAVSRSKAKLRGQCQAPAYHTSCRYQVQVAQRNLEAETAAVEQVADERLGGGGGHQQRQRPSERIVAPVENRELKTWPKHRFLALGSWFLALGQGVAVVPQP